MLVLADSDCGDFRRHDPFTLDAPQVVVPALYCYWDRRRFGLSHFSPLVNCASPILPPAGPARFISYPGSNRRFYRITFQQRRLLRAPASSQYRSPSNYSSVSQRH